MGGDPDHSDAEAPHADETYHKGEVYVTGTAADAAGHNGEAEENLCSSCDAECDAAKIDHLWSFVNRWMMEPDRMYTGMQAARMTAALIRQISFAKRLASFLSPAPKDWPIRQ